MIWDALYIISPCNEPNFRLAGLIQLLFLDLQAKILDSLNWKLYVNLKIGLNVENPITN